MPGMRVLLVLPTLALLFACTPRLQSPTPMAAYRGTWQGRFLAPASDTPIMTWTWVQSADSLGAFTFGRETVSVATRVLSVNVDSIVVALTRPIRAPRFGPAEWQLQFVARVKGDTLTGTLLSTTVGGLAQRSRLDAMRVRPPH